MAYSHLIRIFTNICPKYTWRYFVRSGLKAKHLTFWFGCLTFHSKLFAKFRDKMDTNHLVVQKVSFYFVQVIAFLHFKDNKLQRWGSIGNWLDSFNLIAVLIMIVELQKAGYLLVVVPNINFCDLALFCLF